MEYKGSEGNNLQEMIKETGTESGTRKRVCCILQPTVSCTYDSRAPPNLQTSCTERNRYIRFRGNACFVLLPSHASCILRLSPVLQIFVGHANGM
jgi:hypothetical protein